MIHIFHGEHVEISRRELSFVRKKFEDKEVIVLDGKTVTPNQFKQATETTSIFGNDRLVIFENLLSKRMGRKSTEVEVWVDLVKSLPLDVEIVFWEEKEIGKTILSNFPKNIDIALFKPDKSIFVFVDKIQPNNQRELLALFEQVVEQESAEFAFAMLIRQFRFMIMAKELGKNIGLSPWQASKLTKQAEVFTLPILVNQYRKLLTVDTRIKNGTTAFSLSQEIEQFLVSL